MHRTPSDSQLLAAPPDQPWQHLLDGWQPKMSEPKVGKEPVSLITLLFIPVAIALLVLVALLIRKPWVHAPPAPDYNADTTLVPFDSGWSWWQSTGSHQPGNITSICTTASRGQLSGGDQFEAGCEAASSQVP